MATVIPAILNILSDCLNEPSRNCRVLVKGDVPMGEKAHIEIIPTQEQQAVVSQVQEQDRALIELREENQKLKNSVSLDPRFKWSLLGALGLTLLSFAVLVVLSFQAEMNSQQAELFQMCSTTWKMGFGAVIGLVGGKVL